MFFLFLDHSSDKSLDKLQTMQIPKLASGLLFLANSLSVLPCFHAIYHVQKTVGFSRAFSMTSDDAPMGSEGRTILSEADAAAETKLIMRF